MSRSRIGWAVGLVVVCAVVAGCAKNRPEATVTPIGDGAPSTKDRPEATTVAPSFEPLLAFYRECGLPFPPAGAKLVLIPRVGKCDLGFLMPAELDGNPPQVLVGTRLMQAKLSEVQFVEPGPALIKYAWIEDHCTFEMNAGLATALQCKARGWDKFASALLAESLKTECGHRFSGFFQPAGASPRAAVTFLAWSHWANELIKPDTDRAAILRRLQALSEAEPRAVNDFHRRLLRSLELSLKPSTVERGSVEALVDALVDVAHDRPNGRDDENDPHRILILRGFDAVPALIDHLEDDRLTRTVMVGFNNFANWHKRVGDLASDLLQDLAGEDLGKHRLRRLQGYRVEKEDAQRWWEMARQQGEETYLAERVLLTDPKQEWPNGTMLQLLLHRYPKRLSEVYERLLKERSDMRSDPVADAIEKSSLPEERKRDLFLMAAENNVLEHRHVALDHLAEREPKRMVECLVKTLDQLPPTPKKDYWHCPEARLAHLVLKTDDPRAWEALIRYAKRSDVCLRMEIMHYMNRGSGGDRGRERRLAFLAEFQDDEAVRDLKSDPEKFGVSRVAPYIPRLVVRDFAAWTSASILRLPDKPDQDWTPEQWSKLRADVRAALAKERQQP
jgi:hypothetical protein